jgi:hypothetical protein
MIVSILRLSDSFDRPSGFGYCPPGLGNESKYDVLAPPGVNGFQTSLTDGIGRVAGEPSAGVFP